ncbi:glycosyltransferase family 2 protein [Cyanobium sp. Aljojuca 7D2]|uniref:glycosyltransferase family 2 protein n=1 Tax=Cyanobium sp. Aljojuca 7D2 TaxID=2823698 RepID=UPI0020CFC005|nr:glycosyltransferase family 2 protein [Cyanobium sp. Aljojuca 7D2]MCP9890237.1 glycosyltransferase family 2 protein [Cyanobium sp. Aljojuca 7D2]
MILPTYNGAPYLEAQLASIHAQTLRPLRVLLRDDGSSDGTAFLILALQDYYGAWLQVLPADGNVGCSANVNRLLQATTAPYVALADQDDLWLPQKLEQSMALMQRLELCHGSATPLLLHSDLELVDAQSRPLGCLYLRRQCLNPQRIAPVDLAFTNVVTGCTALLNRALLQKALPIPAESLMHDWWLALVASVFGEIALVKAPGVLYRQHGGNVLGAEGLGLSYWCQRLQCLLQNPAAGGRLREVLRQAELFQERYGKPLSALPPLLQLPRRRRWLALLLLPAEQRPQKHGPLRTIGLYWLLACMPREASAINAN